MDLSEAIRVGYEKVNFAEGIWFEFAGVDIMLSACPMGAAYVGLKGVPNHVAAATTGEQATKVLCEAYPWLADRMDGDDCCDEDPHSDVLNHIIHNVDTHHWSPNDVCKFLDDYTRAGGAK